MQVIYELSDDAVRYLIEKDFTTADALAFVIGDYLSKKYPGSYFSCPSMVQEMGCVLAAALKALGAMNDDE